MENIFSIKFKIKIWTEIVFGYFFNFFRKNMESLEYVFPDRIGGYRFIIEFKSQKPSVTCFKIGLYQNEKEQLALAKIYSEKIKSKEYYCLINEMRTYSGMNYLYEKYGEEIRAEFPDVYIPKMIYHAVKKDSAVLLVEFLEGDIVGNFSLETILKVAGRILDYFYFLGKYSKDPNFIKFFIKRNNLFFLFFINIHTARAIIRDFSFGFNIFRAYLYFILNYVFLLKLNTLQVAHRDLNLKNIIYSEGENEISVIDFGLAVYSNKFLDAAVMSKYMFYSGDRSFEFRKVKIINNILSNNKFLKNYKMLSIYWSIYDLAYCPQAYRKVARNYLTYILNLKYEKL